MKKEIKENWEEEFMKNWMEIRAGNPNFDWRILCKDIQSFISNLLAEEKKKWDKTRLEEISLSAKITGYQKEWEIIKKMIVPFED
jgi:hypothetical protein